jgi:hypothetical protein
MATMFRSKARSEPDKIQLLESRVTELRTQRDDFLKTRDTLRQRIAELAKREHQMLVENKSDDSNAVALLANRERLAGIDSSLEGIDVVLDDAGRQLELERDWLRKQQLASEADQRAAAIMDALTIWAAATQRLAEVVGASQVYGAAQARNNLVALAGNVGEQLTRDFINEERLLARDARLKPEQKNQPAPHVPPPTGDAFSYALPGPGFMRPAAHRFERDIPPG